MIHNKLDGALESNEVDKTPTSFRNVCMFSAITSRQIVPYRFYAPCLERRVPGYSSTKSNWKEDASTDYIKLCLIKSDIIVVCLITIHI